jgi:hypothetical protein
MFRLPVPSGSETGALNKFLAGGKLIHVQVIVTLRNKGGFAQSGDRSVLENLAFEQEDESLRKGDFTKLGIGALHRLASSVACQRLM